MPIYGPFCVFESVCDRIALFNTERLRGRESHNDTSRSVLITVSTPSQRFLSKALFDFGNLDQDKPQN